MGWVIEQYVGSTYTLTAGQYNKAPVISGYSVKYQKNG